VFWYGFLRLFSDYFREYGAEFLGIGRGQYFNLLMAFIGLGLMGLMRRRKVAEAATATRAIERPHGAPGPALWVRQLLFIALVFFCLVIPSSWTQGVLKENREGDKQAIEVNGFGVDYSTIETRAKPDLFAGSRERLSKFG
jgi:phosphatidylglycerol:prolipoprotein diacylglycerol transferase